MNPNLNTANLLKFLTLIILLAFTNTVFSQNISGVIKDSKDSTNIPTVNVYIKGTSIGAISDFDGKFKLRYPQKKKSIDSIVFSFIGYKTKTVAVKDFKNRSVVYLNDDAESLNAIVISVDNTSYEDYLMRQIISNKRYNDPDVVKKSQFKETSYLSVFLANLNKDIVEKNRFKKNKNAFVKESDSTVMMPILLTKEISKHRIDKSDNINSKETIAIEQEGTLEQLNSIIKTTLNKKITQDINFYDENIDLLGRTFQSPIASDYKSYYKIYLEDSTMVNGVKHYKFGYYPKNEKSPAFDGSFWVESKTFALTKIEATLPVVANVNFIKSLSFNVTYKKVADKTWFVKSQKSNTTFSFLNSKKKKGRYFTVQKNQKFSDFELDFNLNEPLVSINDKALKNETIKVGLNEEESSLDSLEFKTIKGIRTLKQNSHIKFLDRFGAMTLNGYYNLNKFDFGPYFDFFIKNGVEGNRFTLPFRTSEKMSKNFTVGGFIGYGDKSKAFTYGLETKFLLSEKKRTVLSAKYFDDFRNIARSRYIEFIRENPYSNGNGNVLAVFQDQDRLNYRVLRQKHLELTLTHEATENARYLIRPFWTKFQDNEFNRFTHNNINTNGFRTLGMLVDLRYSKARNFDQQFFSRIYFGTTKPVYHLTAEIGHNKTIDAPNNSYDAFYARLNASIKKKFLFGKGFMKMYADMGYILGKVPYPILNNPSGNQNLGLARFNYNLLNPTSFSSDIFTNLHLSVNGGGFLFNEMPLLSKLNLRESISFKAFYGKLLNNHNQFFKLPVDLVELKNTPYMELGVGVTNIFKALRMEYVFRLNSGSFYDSVSTKGGLRLRLEVSF